jgi:hypothetical protein
MIFLLAGCVPFPMVAAADGLVVGQSYRLSSGDTLDNDLTVIGGSATLEEDSTVNGSLAVIGGTVTVDGTINGDLSVIGGDVSLGESAVVQGSVDTMGGTLRRADGATIHGDRVENDNPIPHVTTLRTPPLQIGFDPITGPLTAMFQALAMAALAVVVNLFAPVHMERTGRTAFTVPMASGGVGCLTILVLVVMTVTIILIPVSFLGVLAAMIAALFGWLAIGLLIGRQIGILLKQSWTEPVNAGVGTLVITLLASIPCIGALAWTLGGLVALGAVVLTRFGTQVYPSPYSVAPVPQSGPYTSQPAPAPVQEIYPPEEPRTSSTGARVYPVESDQPGENAPDENISI